MRILTKALASATAMALFAAFALPALAGNAVLSQTSIQATSGNMESSADTNTAGAMDYAFQNATGNIGANAASGDMNAQSNVTYIDSSSGSAGPFDFTGAFAQAGTDNAVSSFNTNTAGFQAWAFQNASGNIGANAASGNMNQQQNGAVILDSDQLASAAVATAQANAGNLVLSCDLNTAGFQNFAFQNASGNVGANAASGNGNQQINTLTLEH